MSNFNSSSNLAFNSMLNSNRFSSSSPLLPSSSSSVSSAPLLSSSSSSSSLLNTMTSITNNDTNLNHHIISAVRYSSPIQDLTSLPTQPNHVHHHSADNSSDSLSSAFDTPETQPIYSLLILLPIAATVANLLLICVLLKDRRFQKSLSAKYFVLSLSVSDLLVSLIIMPFGVASSVASQWLFGAFWCEMWQTLDYFACTASIFNLCAITFDRYLAITQPIRYSLLYGRRRLLFVIFGVWIAAALVTFPPMIVHQLGFFRICKNDECGECETLFFEPSYVLTSSIITFFIPTLLMLVVNYRTHAIARRQIAAYRSGAKFSNGQPPLRINFPRQSVPPAATSSVSCTSDVGHHHDSSSHSKWLLSRSKSPNQHTRLAANGNARADHTGDKQNGGGHNIYYNRNGVTINNNNNVCNDKSGELKTKSIALDTNKESGGMKTTEFSSYPNSLPHPPLNQKSSSHSTGSAGTTHGGAANSRGGGGHSNGKSVHHFVLLSTEYKATKTLGLVMGVFLISWMPYYVVFVVMPFCTVCQSIEKAIVPITLWLGWANSGMNAWIVFAISKKLRRQLRQLLTGNR